MLGNVWPERNTAFPDFLDPTNQTTQWWTNEFVLFHQTVSRIFRKLRQLFVTNCIIYVKSDHSRPKMNVLSSNKIDFS